MLLRQEAHLSQWCIARIVNVYSDSKGNVRSVRLLIGDFDNSNNSTQYLERPAYKLVVLVDSNH